MAVTVEVRNSPDTSAPTLPWAVGVFGLPGVLGAGIKWITRFATKAEANAWLSAQTFKSITQLQQLKEQPPWAVGIDGLGADGGIKWIARFLTSQAATQYRNSLTWGGIVLAA